MAKKRSSDRTKGRQPIDAEVWKWLQPAPAGKGRVGAELIRDSVVSEEITLQGIDVLYIEGCTFRDVKFVDFSGDLFLASGVSKSVYEGCTFQNFRTSTLGLGYATYVECSFLEFEVDSVRSTDASVAHCTLDGAATTAVFSIEPGPMRVQSGSEVLRFEENDLSRFVCPDITFRGGIALSNQRIRESEANVLLLDMPRLLELLKQSGRVDKYSSKQLKQLEYMQKRCAATGQRDLLIGSAVFDMLSDEDREVVLDLKALVSALPH